VVLAVALCLSVRPSVTSRSSVNVKMTERTELVFGVEATSDLSYTVLKGNSGISKNKKSQILDLKIFATARRSSRVLLTQADAQCNELATVVGDQFITPSVHLCVQHDGREAARRAGLSVAAEACFANWCSSQC